MIHSIVARLILRASLVGLLLALPALAWAQGTSAVPLTAQQTQQVLEVLQDPAKRSAFIATLQNMAHALPAEHAAAPAAAPLALTPDSLGAQVVTSVSSGAQQLSDQLVTTAKAVLDVPLLWGWIRFQFIDPIARAQMIDTTWKLAVVLSVAGLALSIARRALRRPLRALAERAAARFAHQEEGDDDAAPPAAAAVAAPAPPGSRVALPSMLPAPTAQAEPPAVAGPPVGIPADADPSLQHRRLHPALLMLRRLPYLAAALVLYLIPVTVFAAVGSLLVAAGLGSTGTAHLVIRTILDSAMIGYTVLAVTRLLVAPEAPALRLLAIGTETAVFLRFWVLWLTIVSLSGVSLVQIAGFMGMYSGAREALLKVVTLVLHIMVAVIVVQSRARVTKWLRAPKGARGPIAAFRNRLAAIWHIIALFYIMAAWVVLALEIQDGLFRLLRFAVFTTLTISAFRVLSIVLVGGLERLFKVTVEDSGHPVLMQRLARYHRLARLVLRGALAAVAGIALLEVWGLDSLAWFAAGALGGQVVSAILSAALTVLIGLVIWEVSNTSIQQHISRLERDAQMARSARFRTLLPILRTMLLVAILLVVGLTVLSDIGVNIGPLLAGAGIVGVAIGFGSQKLVQDLITGLFLLMENAMQVGDWVTAAGLSGSVETLSIRTMRLRAADGSVHIVPFSSVTTVTNTNRGLGNAAVTVNVAYREDTDRVCEVLKQIASTMREEREFQGAMLSELQLWGVDAVDGAMVTIAGQIVCTASGRWAVQREYNRRMKQRFQELGIEIYNPHSTIRLEQMVVAAPAEQADTPTPEPSNDR
jgi:small-conductance mechanosensitive channel